MSNVLNGKFCPSDDARCIEPVAIDRDIWWRRSRGRQHNESYGDCEKVGSGLERWLRLGCFSSSNKVHEAQVLDLRGNQAASA